MTDRCMPIENDFYVTSGFGARWDTTHWGTDFGCAGGSANRPIYAAQSGTVTAAGPASGFGQWINIDHPVEAGAGLTVYGHIIPEVRVGQQVRAGECIGYINPNSNTNGGVDPHLHFEVHKFVWSPPGPNRLDPQPWLTGCRYPNDPPPIPTAPVPDPWLPALEQLMGPVK